jgi:hypothetical protein
LAIGDWQSFEMRLEHVTRFTQLFGKVEELIRQSQHTHVCEQRVGIELRGRRHRN